MSLGIYRYRSVTVVGNGVDLMHLGCPGKEIMNQLVELRHEDGGRFQSNHSEKLMSAYEVSVKVIQ